MFARNHMTEMRWFEGVVENRMDPLKLGRVQVRIFGLHTDDLTQIPESELLWASVMMPVTSGSMNGVGQTPALVEGTHVIGFFRDGDQSQDAIIMGSVPGIPIEERKTNKGFYDHRTDLSGAPKKPVYTSGNNKSEASATPFPRPEYLDEPDINRLARNEKTAEGTFLKSKSNTRGLHTGVTTATGSYSEPAEAYNAKYPYNKVWETESGHVIEMDDTPGAERVLIAHRSGAYVEMFPDGKMVLKTTNAQYNHVGADKFEHTIGGHNVSVDANGTLYVKGNYNIKVDGDVNWMVGGNVNWMIGGEMNLVIGTTANWSSGANININAGANLAVGAAGSAGFSSSGSTQITAGPEVKVSAGVINLN